MKKIVAILLVSLMMLSAVACAAPAPAPAAEPAPAPAAEPAPAPAAEPVAAEPIHGFSGKCHQAALTDNRRCRFNLRRIRIIPVNLHVLRFHTSTAFAAAGRNTTTRSIPA